MSYIIEKHFTRKYEVVDICQFLLFSTFHSVRKGMRFNPVVCFECGHKFADNEHTYLGIVKGDKNRIFCKSCAEKIALELGQELKSIKKEE